MTHETYCALEDDHYGPCAPTESEFYVANNEGKVLWRQSLPASPGYSDNPESEYQRVYRPAHQEARAACLSAAFRLGYLPAVRNHSRWTDSVDWPIEVTEETERGDLILTLPMGRFRLKARRAHKGETTCSQVHAFGGQAVGVGAVASTDNESAPVLLFGRVINHEYSPSGYAVQPSSVEYADGTSSGYLGSDVRNLERVETCGLCGGVVRFQKQVPDGDPNGTTLNQYECTECGTLAVED